MNTLIAKAQGYYEIKGSKFLSFITPFNEFNTLCDALYKEHAKAVHFVSASRYFNEYQRVVESFDDDREPKGSGGMPSLNVLRGEDLVNVGVVIVRYFGGRLLGVGGLVRAYTSATQNAIETAKNIGLIEGFVVKKTLVLEVAYSMLSQYEYEANRLGLNVFKEAFLTHGVRLKISGEENNLNTFCHKRFE